MEETLSKERSFRARDMFRDGPTFFRFSAVMGLQMGQVLPAAFVGLMLPVIYREQGLSLICGGSSPSP